MNWPWEKLCLMEFFGKHFMDVVKICVTSLQMYEESKRCGLGLGWQKFVVLNFRNWGSISFVSIPMMMLALLI